MENRRVSMNRHTNLLQLEEHMYPLVDVATPNVFRNLFPYSEVPKIAFNDRVVPHHMPDDIRIGKCRIFFQSTSNSTCHQRRRHRGAAFHTIGIRFSRHAGHDLISRRHNIRLAHAFRRWSSP